LSLSTELWLDFLGIRLDSRKAEGLRFAMNLITPDNGERFAIESKQLDAHFDQGSAGQEPGPELAQPTLTASENFSTSCSMSTSHSD
jgi:alkyl sulfatase BDS1-like metallo-beta-lactamase superfamily hydrolase